MAGKRQNISSGSKFEETFGYSRAVKVGETLFISGTVGMDYKAGHVPEAPAEQLQQIITNMQPALDEAGASLADIVQITVYVTSPEVFEDVGPELGRIFGDIRPTSAALVVAFPVPDVKVELSATAIIGCGA